MFFEWNVIINVNNKQVRMAHRLNNIEDYHIFLFFNKYQFCLIIIIIIFFNQRICEIQENKIYPSVSYIYQIS